MQAYYEIETDIPVNHQLHLKLPETIPAGRAKIAVIYEVAEQQIISKQSLMAAFLNTLPEPETQGLNREQIQAYLDEERAGWDD